MNFHKIILTTLAGLLLASCGGNNDSLSSRGDLVEEPIEKSTQSILQLDSVTSENGLQVLTGPAIC